MYYYKLSGHEFNNDIQTIIQVFYPNLHYFRTDEINDEGYTLKSVLNENSAGAEIYENGILKDKFYDRIDSCAEEKAKKRLVKAAAYRVLCSFTGQNPPWGMLTGIRPAKIINILLDEGLSDEEAEKELSDKYFVRKDKAKLAKTVAVSERKVLSENRPEDINIYIGIPFCPTRCVYCSFISYPLSSYKGKTAPYTEALSQELKLLSGYTKKRNIKSIYIGGGTPTSLDPYLLEKILDDTRSAFDISKETEFTVEAGRPDTLDGEKLRLIKKYGATRISINPQTMNDKTLKAIGRNHTAADIEKAFSLAREAGHKNINADIILGLSEESPEDVYNTLEKIERLSPEGLTVHTLAVKRASRLKEELCESRMTPSAEIEKMLEISSGFAYKLNMRPYYMYRQKNMAGNFENVGYCKEGFECLYNIEIMEEKETILAAGAGAVTKTVDSETNRINRIFNLKNVDEYILRIDEMLERKRKGLIIY